MVTLKGSIQNMMHSLFGCVKTVFRGRQRDKDTSLVAPKLSISVVIADPDIKDSPANSKYDISQPCDSDPNMKGFWQMAYDELKKSDPNSVAALFLLTGAKPQDADDART